MSVAESRTSGPLILSVVVPVLNEEANLRELVRLLSLTLDGAGIPFELLFVNDGSTDGTRSILTKLHHADPRVKSLHLARNFGHQAAISAGLQAAGGDAVVIMDGDLQDSPDMLLRLVEEWRRGADVVYAVRSQRSESVVKRAAYGLFYRLLDRISDIRIPLDTGDFSLLGRNVVDVLNSMPERTRFIRGMRSWVGFRQVGVEHVRGPRFAGTAKYTFGKLLRLAFDGFVGFSYRPLQLASLFGAVVSVMAFLLALGLVVLKLTHGIPLLGWTSLMVGMLFFGGVQLICVGILGEYVGRIYEEVRGRPPYVVASVLGDVQGRIPSAERPRP